jgi:hypothetical protein
LVGLAVWVLRSHTDELSGLSGLYSRLRWWWVVVAVAVEAFSVLSFAEVQRRLLRAGSLDPSLPTLVAVTLTSQAITNSLPAGSAAAAVYGFRWYRRLGATDALAAWTLVGALVTSVLSLALLVAAGLALATEDGGSLDLIPVTIAVVVLTCLVGAFFVSERLRIVVLARGLRFGRRLIGRPRGDIDALVARLTVSLGRTRMGTRDVAAVMSWGAGNWLFDCACFALSFLAIGAGIPWKGLLVAYGAGQLAANLPITPGGLGAVEGSLTIALVAFGGAQASTVAAVLIYRLISFWLQLPIGWGAGGILALGVRRGRWPRRVVRAALGEPATVRGVER